MPQHGVEVFDCWVLESWKYGMHELRQHSLRDSIFRSIDVDNA